MTTAFADALTAGGYEVTVATVPGADHPSIYSAEVVGPRLVEWLGAGQDPPTGHAFAGTIEVTPAGPTSTATCPTGSAG